MERSGPYSCHSCFVPATSDELIRENDRMGLAASRPQAAEVREIRPSLEAHVLCTRCGGGSGHRLVPLAPISAGGQPAAVVYQIAGSREPPRRSTSSSYSLQRAEWLPPMLVSVRVQVGRMLACARYTMCAAHRALPLQPNRSS